MASISGSVTIAGDPDDWIAVAWDADTHAYAGVATVSGGAYTISGLTAGKAYVVGCRPKSGAVWKSDYPDYAVSDLVIPTDPIGDPYLFKCTSLDNEGGDALWDYVKLLSHFNGSNDSTTLVDERGHTLTAQGNAKLATSEKKYGSAALALDGTGDFVTVTDSADFDISGDFAIEAWVYPVSVSGTRFISSIFATKNIGIGIIDGKLTAQWDFINHIQGSTNVSTNVWSHVALSRNGTTVRLFLNGVSQGTVTKSDTFNPAQHYIGAYNSNADYPFSGYIDDYRMTIGQARYTSDFDVPVAEMPAFSIMPTGSTEPTWPPTPGNTVVDGGVTWTNMGQLLDPLIAGPLIAV